MLNKYSVIGNYDKLPDDIKSELQTINETEIKILQLFQQESNLDVDNIMIGLFLEYGIKIKQKSLNTILKKLHKTNHLSLQKDMYYLKEVKKKPVATTPQNIENKQVDN